MIDRRMICVVGGSGFIGSRFCARLRALGRDFSIVDKKQSRIFSDRVAIADVRSVDAVRNAVPTGAVLVNLAAEHCDDVRPKSLYDQVNVEGARNLCLIAREKNVKYIVFTSTVAVYGFANPDTDESGKINYFNDYGRTKWLAEEVFKEWQQEAPDVRTLIIVRPTVVFGEQNRGNVYNLLRQIAGGKFVMIGNGRNRKSMAYVENIAAFLEHSLSFPVGVHIYNYIDKPDFSMNELVSSVRCVLGKGDNVGFRLPYWMGLAVGKLFDAAALVTGRRFSISSIRVKKFCATTQFGTHIGRSGFEAPVALRTALVNTVRYEFLEEHSNADVFFTE